MIHGAQDLISKRPVGDYVASFLREFDVPVSRVTVASYAPFDSSLHPKIIEALVGKHHNAPRVSQLVFTTHDTHLMDSGLLRRDQIWITERDANGATRLFSIHDFKGRQSEDIEKRYYEGRYRGLPLTTKR